MSKTCKRQVAGGKGNFGMFIDRQPNICAAGRPSPLNEPSISVVLSLTTLQDEVDALIHDSIIPPPPKPASPPLSRQPLIRDVRHMGSNTEAQALINPPVKTKFQTLVEDLKETVYASYWNKAVGKIPDVVSKLPEGTDIFNKTFGSKPPHRISLYDVVMPNDQVHDEGQKTDSGKCNVNRNYPSPFNPDAVFGAKYKNNVRESTLKQYLTDDRIPIGIHLKKHINVQHVEFLERTQARLGVPLFPINNMAGLPQGHVFGVNTSKDAISVANCLNHSHGVNNTQKELVKKSLVHLNTLRKCLSKRYDALFFKNLYLGLKRFDQCKTGWLPKKLVYDYCASRFIHIDKNLLENLLLLWKICNGAEIEYKSFVNVINFTQVTPHVPKIEDAPDLLVENRTIYSDMTKGGQETDTRLRAGAPSGWYLEKDTVFIPDTNCKADQGSLPHETDVRGCLNPSMFTIMGLSHRDMFAPREPITIRRVFEAAGEEFTNDSFDLVWEMAKKCHSQGLVCYETFRRAMREFNGEEE